MRSGTCSLRTIPMIPSSWRNRFVRRGTAPDDGTSGLNFESSSQKQCGQARTGQGCLVVVKRLLHPLYHAPPTGQRN